MKASACAPCGAVAPLHYFQKNSALMLRCLEWPRHDDEQAVSLLEWLQGYAKEEESFSLKKRLQEFKRENDKFADIKAQLKGQVAQLQDSLAKKEEENQNLLAACEQLVFEREAAKSRTGAGRG